MDKEVGIITHYYRSTNYGGVLQAYALCKYLNDNGYYAEQIRYKRNDGNLIRRLGGRLYHAIVDIPQKIKHVELYKIFEKRRDVFECFKKQNVAQSETVYKHQDLKRLATEYKVLITGSDQVWHPIAVCDIYLLSIGVPGVKKIAYAASVARDELTPEESQRYREAFADFRAISVREESAVSLIQNLSTIKVNLSVDPVFLLSVEQWNDAVGAGKERKKYVFCYFLGDSVEQRCLAQEYANELQLEIVTLPYLNNQYRECDDEFGEERIYCADPFEFVRLIRDAEVVLTDSFHAMAFSLIFQKQFFVFERKFATTMASRILSMAKIFHVMERFCNEESKMKIDYLLTTNPVNYSRSVQEFDALRNDSIRFLKDNINACLGELKE